MGKFQVQPSKLIMCLALSLLAQGESGVQTLASPNKFIDDSKGPGSKGHINYSATVYISCIHLYIRGNCSNPWWTCLQFQRHLIRSSKWSNLDAPESIEPRWLAKIWPYRSLSIAPKTSRIPTESPTSKDLGVGSWTSTRWIPKWRFGNVWKMICPFN